MKEKIIKKIEEYSIKHYSCDPAIKYEWWEISDTDKAGLADELLSILEQEKKEQATLIMYEIRHESERNGVNGDYSYEIKCADFRRIAKEYEVEL